MPGRNWIILAVAVAIGLVAVVFTNSYFSGVEQREARVAQEQQLARIVVASQPLAFGTPLTIDNVRLANFPASSVPQGAFRSIPDAIKGGRVALRPIVVGEPVLAGKVSGSDGRATLAANLPEGMRAVSIPVSAVTGVSGFARPGDTVDVILTRQMPGEGATGQDLMSDVILENVQVLAVDQIADEAQTEPKVGKTATLQVDLFGAQKLALAERAGTLSLALRNVENQLPGPGTTVTTRDLGSGGYYIPGRAAPAVVSAPMFIPPAFTGPAAMPARAVAAIPRITGPSMSVFRGTEKTEYEVGRLGGY